MDSTQRRHSLAVHGFVRQNHTGLCLNDVIPIISGIYMMLIRAEMDELHDLLSSPASSTRETAVKKVISKMNPVFGASMHEFFHDVVKSMGSSTSSLTLKKAIYLYCVNIAQTNSEKLMMTIGCHLRDSYNHPDPGIRRIALRSLTNMNIPRIAEYAFDPVHICLEDERCYVRSTAALAVGKLYSINGKCAEIIRERGFPSSLRQMISRDCQHSQPSSPSFGSQLQLCNAVASLCEMSEHSSIDFFKMDETMALKLLAALRRCGEYTQYASCFGWTKAQIMYALSMFEFKKKLSRKICSVVSQELEHANSGVVMEAVKLIFKMRQNWRERARDRYMRRIARAMVRLMSRPYADEMQFVALRNIALMLRRFPLMFDQHDAVFRIECDDAEHMKRMKLDTLIKMAQHAHKNVPTILDELERHAQEVDVDFARLCVCAIGRIAVKVHHAICVDQCIATLLTLSERQIGYVTEEITVCCL